jgi:hypothetical protein
MDRFCPNPTCGRLAIVHFLALASRFPVRTGPRSAFGSTLWSFAEPPLACLASRSAPGWVTWMPSDIEGPKVLDAGLTALTLRGLQKSDADYPFLRRGRFRRLLWGWWRRRRQTHRRLTGIGHS